MTRQTPISELPKLLTIKEFAEYLGRSPKAIYSSIYKGMLEGYVVKIAGSIYIKREVLEQLKVNN